MLSSTASQSMLNWDAQFKSTFLIWMQSLVPLHPEPPWGTPQRRNDRTTRRVWWEVQAILFILAILAKVLFLPKQAVTVTNVHQYICPGCYSTAVLVTP